MGAGGGNVPIEFATLGPNNQNYVQATFPYLNVYMGVLMVYNAAAMRQSVHCRSVPRKATPQKPSPDDARLSKASGGFFGILSDWAEAEGIRAPSDIAPCTVQVGLVT